MDQLTISNGCETIEKALENRLLDHTNLITLGFLDEAQSYAVTYCPGLTDTIAGVKSKVLEDRRRHFKAFSDAQLLSRYQMATAPPTAAETLQAQIAGQIIGERIQLNIWSLGSGANEKSASESAQARIEELENERDHIAQGPNHDEIVEDDLNRWHNRNAKELEALQIVIDSASDAGEYRQHLKIAADTPEELRACDVDRLADSMPERFGTGRDFWRWLVSENLSHRTRVTVEDMRAQLFGT